MKTHREKHDFRIDSLTETITESNTSISIMSKKQDYKKLMHHNFCVLDFKKVLYGSYNWTIKAENNDEMIWLIEDKLSAEEFATEFIRIRELLNQK